MYTKPPINSFLVLVGISTPLSMTTATRTARFMLQVVGIGFGLYCITAAVLLLLAVTLRGLDRTAPSTARNGA